MEMGATRSAAISALRACKGDVNEAAIVVFDPLHAEATLSDSDSQLLIAEPLGQTSKPSEACDEDAQDDEMTSVEAESDDGEIHEDIDFFEDEVQEVGADPFAQIFFQKDRKEIMLEIEETPEKVELTIHQSSQPAIIMPQSQWMKGCAEGNEQSFLFQIYSRLTDNECACVADKCNGIIQRQRTDFFAIPDTFALYIQHLEQVVRAKCPDCGRVICLACSDEVAAPSASKEPLLAGDTPATLLHCPDLQAVILGVGLSLVEKMYYGTLQSESLLPSPEMRPSKKTKLDTPPINQTDLSENESFEIPHHSHARGVRSGPKGVGYGGASAGCDDQSGQEAASRIQKMQDQSLASLLASVRVFMPNRSRIGPFRSSDHMPSIATAIHIRRRFNPIASDLLKNDSLSDMSDRRVLYEEFLEWLLIVSAHENLGSIMGQPIMRETSSRYLPATTNSTAEGTREKEITYEGSAGPRELLENLSRQVKAARHAMRHSESESQVKKGSSLYHLSRGKDDKEVEKLESFCERFEKAVTSIDSSLESNNNRHVIEAIKSLNCVHVPVSNDLSSVSLDILQTRYVKWATSVKYEYYDFEVPRPPDEAPGDGATRATESVPSLGSNAPKYLHAYAREIQNTFSYPARNTAIAREHSTLIGALPISWDSSVFLRVDESRPDVIKALITGPEGTPYSNGCFIFDIFLNSNYNQSPPHVKTMTTKGGKYRLNPNLYADGKVCLSLLGTWQGPGWIGGKSTLLQVIISIQSMILCQEPYLNEPGWMSMSGTPESKAYNLNVRRMVVDDAMIGSIKNPNPAFADVIKTHFRLKSQVIKDQLDQWLAEDDGQPLRSDNLGGAVGQARVGNGQDPMLARNVEEMKQLLDQLAIEPETEN